MIFRRLEAQHRSDLKVYRSAHKDHRNRALHWLMIPLEYASFSLVLASLLPDGIATLIGVGNGLLAVGISTDKVVGRACFMFHILVVLVCTAIVYNSDLISTMTVALTVWSLAWALQVCVGHWFWEKNQPNLADGSPVSILSMCQSVLIAWSS